MEGRGVKAFIHADSMSGVIEDPEVIAFLADKLRGISRPQSTTEEISETELRSAAEYLRKANRVPVGSERRRVFKKARF